MVDKRNKWTDDELVILKDNYIEGLSKILNKLPNHTKNSIKKKAKSMGLSVDKNKLYFDLDEIKKVVEESFSFAEVFRKLNKAKSGDSYKVIKRYIEKNDIDYSHFDPWKNNALNIKNNEKPIEYWLNINTSINSSKLKTKLYNKGLKQRECEMCSQGEDWNGEKMSLILDHINGISNDNRLENLQIVCPNCNATLPTHCRGSKGLEEKVEVKYYCECGNTKSKYSKKCLECSNKIQRKVERPPYNILLNEIKNLGYTGTGRKYGVSDNSIRKWKKTYEK